MPLVPTNPSKLCRQIVGDLIPIMQNQMDNKMESDMKTGVIEESIGIGTVDIKNLHDPNIQSYHNSQGLGYAWPCSNARCSVSTEVNTSLD